MSLDMSEWKEFRVGDLFDLKPTKGRDSTELLDGDDISYIGAKKEMNGLMMRCQLAGFEEWVSDGNCIVFVCLGAGSAGYTTYQKDDFIGMSGKTICGYDKNLNPIIGNFLVTILDCERPKYSFSRSWNGDRLKNTIIKLPIQHNLDGTPYIDPNYTYSEEGYVPDWQFMEAYMKSLHHKPLTTKNIVRNGLTLNVDEWKYFYLKDICDISMGNKMDWSAMTMDNPDVNFVGRSADNNGVAGKVDFVDGVEPYDSGCITVALGGSLGAAYVQNEKFYTSQNVAVLKFEDSVSDGAKLFISCLIMNESKYKYFPFGRELNTHIRTDFGFTLPIQHNTDGTPYIDPNYTYSEEGYVPDWQFMEDYMKALPYGDRL